MVCILQHSNKKQEHEKTNEERIADIKKKIFYEDKKNCKGLEKISKMIENIVICGKKDIFPSIKN